MMKRLLNTPVGYELTQWKILALMKLAFCSNMEYWPKTDNDSYLRVDTLTVHCEIFKKKIQPQFAIYEK